MLRALGHALFFSRSARAGVEEPVEDSRAFEHVAESRVLYEVFIEVADHRDGRRVNERAEIKFVAVRAHATCNRFKAGDLRRALVTRRHHVAGRAL